MEMIRGRRAMPPEDEDEDDVEAEVPKSKFGFQQVTAMPSLNYNDMMDRQKKNSLMHKESMINMDEHKDKMASERHQTDLLKDIKSQKNKPIGLLAVHVKKGTFYNLDPTSDYEREDISVYIRMYSSRQLKTTCCYDDVYTPAELVFDDIRHFMLLPSDDRTDMKNMLRLEVAVFDSDKPRQHRVLASKEIHMYDIIKNLYLVEKYEMIRIQTLIAEIEVEMCFTYGAMGYGCANQFENRRIECKEVLTHSMFYRPDPPPKRQDSGRKDVMTCTHVGHPSFIEFNKKVDIGSVASEFGEEISLHDWQLAEEPNLLINKIKRHMDIMKRELFIQRNRRERLKFLRQLVLSDMPHVNETHKEEVIVPKTFRLTHRRAPNNQNPEAVSFEALEEEEFDPNLISPEVVSAQAEMLGLAPGINTRRARGPVLQPEEPGQQEGGFLSALVNTFRRFSFRPGAEVAPAPPVRRDPSLLPRGLTIPGVGGIEEEDEDEEPLPVIAMRPLDAPAGGGGPAGQQGESRGGLSIITGFIRRLSSYPAPASQVPTMTSSSSMSSQPSTGSMPMRRARRGSVAVGPPGGRRGSLLQGAGGIPVGTPGGSRRGSVASRRGSLVSDPATRGRSGSLMQDLVSKLSRMEEKPPEPPVRVMLQPPSPDMSDTSDSSSAASSGGEESDTDSVTSHPVYPFRIP